MKCLSAPLGITLVVLLAAASQARADYLNWTYTSSPNVAGISVGGSSSAGGASVTLTDFSSSQPGAKSIPVIAYVTNTSSTTGVMFSSSANTPSTYNLAVTITDGTTHQSETLNFTGSLSGSLSATSSSVSASFSPGSLTTPVPLNGYNYTVTIPTVTLASPTSPQQDIMATVSVASANPSTHHGGVPEPASVVLGSLGFSCFGIGCWLKRRVQRAKQLAYGV